MFRTQVSPVLHTQLLTSSLQQAAQVRAPTEDTVEVSAIIFGRAKAHTLIHNMFPTIGNVRRRGAAHTSSHKLTQKR